MYRSQLLTLGLFLIFSYTLSAQVVEKRIATIILKDGSELVGEVILENDVQLVLESQSLGKVNILRQEITLVAYGVAFEGKAWRETLDDVRCNPIQGPLSAALADMEAATAFVVQALADEVEVALGASFNYLMQAGYLLGGWHLARSALLAAQRLEAGSDRLFYRQKIATAVFYAQQILPRCAGHAGAVMNPAALQSYPLEWI